MYLYINLTTSYNCGIILLISLPLSISLYQSAVSGLKNNTDVADDVIICDITNEDAEVTVDTTRVVDEG